jgi:uncharacterized protein YbjT (DUF2867 family)
MTNTPAPIAVIGATGQQGGAVVAALLERGAPVRAIVRDAAKAHHLAARGVDVALADLDDGKSLRRAFRGVAAVFAVTTFTGPLGTEGEVAHGRAIADAAHDAQVPRLVYTSVGAADRATGILQFESKAHIEQYLHDVGVPTVVIRPTFFMDNFLNLFVPTIEDDLVVLRAPLTLGVPLQMIAVEDIGKAAATALLDPSAVPGGTVEIATEERTPEAIADSFGAAQGRPGRFYPVPLDAVEDDDFRRMFHWFTKLPAFQADMERTRALVGNITDLSAFTARHRIPTS